MIPESKGFRWYAGKVLQDYDRDRLKHPEAMI